MIVSVTDSRTKVSDNPTRRNLAVVCPPLDLVRLQEQKMADEDLAESMRASLLDQGFTPRNEDHVAILRQGVKAWNEWRTYHVNITPNLSGADLSGMDLSGIDLSEAGVVQSNLSGVCLERANLFRAALKASLLKNATFICADLHEADLTLADLTGAHLNHADLKRTDLSFTRLNGADFSTAQLGRANLLRADLTGANLRYADLSFADLSEADFTGADLSETSLVGARFHGTKLTKTDLTGARVYGISVWDIIVDRETTQMDLIISPEKEPRITVDCLEIAQFIYLLLKNERIRQVIDTLTSKVVLILGRFTPERKAILDALREALRKCDYVPVLFDFEVPSDRDVTETVTLLARMARFIVADLSEASSIPKELESIVPQLAVPVLPLIEGSNRPYSMFKDYWKYDWVLPVYNYENRESLLSSLKQDVIAPAEKKFKDLQIRRSVI
jgi:uncharacterized protein YjbI with pentapeptide repeats